MKSDINPYDIPAYSAPQAAHYVGVAYGTLRAWVGAKGLISTPVPNLLSFNNLAEAHILKSMRRNHRLSMQAIRRALDELGRVQQTAHPLLSKTFGTDGVDLCIDEEGQIVNLNKQSQTEIRDFVALYLQRIERNKAGKATGLYPFVARGESAAEPRHISITPTISFGRPVLAGTGISTAVIAGRFAARDSVEQLAREFDVEQGILEDAIRWEMLKGKAA